MAVATDGYVSKNLDFTKKSTFRKHKIVCGGTTFFVSGVRLAEESPYFHKAFFGDFIESKNNTFTCPDENPSNVLKYLKAVYGIIDVQFRNCAVLIRFSDMWDTPLLRSKCAEVLDGWLHVPNIDSTCKKTIAVLEAALLHGYRGHIKNILFRLIQFDYRELTRNRFVERIDDRFIVAAVQEQCLSKSHYQPKDFFHNFFKCERFGTVVCDVSFCYDERTHKCKGCNLQYCGNHASVYGKIPCPKPDIRIPYLDKIIPVEGGTQK